MVTPLHCSHSQTCICFTWPLGYHLGRCVCLSPWQPETVSMHGSRTEASEVVTPVICDVVWLESGSHASVLAWPDMVPLSPPSCLLHSSPLSSPLLPSKYLDTFCQRAINNTAQGRVAELVISVRLFSFVGIHITVFFFYSITILALWRYVNKETELCKKKSKKQ